VIDGKTNKVIGNVKVGNTPSAVAVNPNTNMVYVTSDDINQLSVFNPDQELK
jgi:DNA-binding beta-propeller fold protein YncE